MTTKRTALQSFSFLFCSESLHGILSCSYSRRDKTCDKRQYHTVDNGVYGNGKKHGYSYAYNTCRQSHKKGLGIEYRLYIVLGSTDSSEYTDLTGTLEH